MTHTTKILLFTSGFTILAIQFLGIRVLGPFTGVTTTVWAMLISVALCASALGYYGGGALADRMPKARLHVIFLMGATLSLIAVPYLQGGVMWLLDGFSPIFTTAIAATLLFVVPIACLAALTTYTIRLHIKTLATFAQVHGDFFAFATIGSVVGTFVTTYVLIPAMGTLSIFTTLGVIIAGVGLLAIFCDKSQV